MICWHHKIGQHVVAIAYAVVAGITFYKCPKCGARGCER